jgi:hypothetical protein
MVFTMQLECHPCAAVRIGACTQELEQLSTLAGLPIKRLPPLLMQLLSKLPFPRRWQRAAKSWPSLSDMWLRRSSDDLAFFILLVISEFITTVPTTQVNMGDARSLVCMCTKCRKEIIDCVQDPECKKALDGACVVFCPRLHSVPDSSCALCCQQHRDDTGCLT